MSRASSCSSVEQAKGWWRRRSFERSPLLRSHRCRTPSVSRSIRAISTGDHIAVTSQPARRRTPTSSSARSSTTSGRRSPCCCSRASTCSAWRGCGSPRPRRCSRSGAGRGGRCAHVDAPSAAVVAWGAVLAVMNVLLLPRDRPAAARHRRRDRVPARDRAGGARRADAAQRRRAARSPSPASTCSPTCSSRASRSASRSRSPTPCCSRSTSCSGTASRAARALGGIDGLGAAMLVALVVVTPLGGLGRAAGARRPGRARGGHRRRHLLVGDPVRLRPARDGAAAARDLRAAGLAAARDRDGDRRGRARAGAVSASRRVGVALVVGGVALHRERSAEAAGSAPRQADQLVQDRL